MTSTITKEQWNGIQNTLSDLYSRVEFKLFSGEKIAVYKVY